MWTLLTDCGKQIIPHCRLREKNNEDNNIYEVLVIESDQYKLKQLYKNDVMPEPQVEVVLTCEQIKKFNFEIETP